MKYGVDHNTDLKEYRRRQSAARREKDPVRYLYNQAKYRAKLRNIEFNIALEDLKIPEVCPVFGIKLEFREGRRHEGSYSIDRRDNSQGYTKENTYIISWKANQYKGDMTVEEVESLLKYMKGE